MKALPILWPRMVFIVEVDDCFRQLELHYPSGFPNYDWVSQNCYEYRGSLIVFFHAECVFCPSQVPHRT